MSCASLHRGGLPAFPGCFAGADQQHAAVAGQQLHPRLDLVQRRINEGNNLGHLQGLGCVALWPLSAVCLMFTDVPEHATKLQRLSQIHVRQQVFGFLHLVSV